jgi:hypothetical protein
MLVLNLGGEVGSLFKKKIHLYILLEAAHRTNTVCS